MYTVPRIRDYVVHRLEAGRRRLLVDLAGAAFMDSMGLGVLVGTRKCPASSTSPACTGSSRSMTQWKPR
ncbi:STAS domain-containing protein [Streptomyces sp. GD-15H]|uniref:STAS domain-containing protein n=1 Tax=Streptomyces sp. GD-15H TaxID=3129112 RepID=UPI003873B2B8